MGFRAPSTGAERGVRVLRPLPRILARLMALAQWQGDDSPLLADVWLELDALAAWLATPVSGAAAAAKLLQAQGLLTMHDGMQRAIALRANRWPP